MIVLDFEQPIQEMQKKIDELKKLNGVEKNEKNLPAQEKTQNDGTRLP